MRIRKALLALSNALSLLNSSVGLLLRELFSRACLYRQRVKPLQ